MGDGSSETARIITVGQGFVRAGDAVTVSVQPPSPARGLNKTLIDLSKVAAFFCCSPSLLLRDG